MNYLKNLVGKNSNNKKRARTEEEEDHDKEEIPQYDGPLPDHLKLKDAKLIKKFRQLYYEFDYYFVKTHKNCFTMMLSSSDIIADEHQENYHIFVKSEKLHYVEIDILISFICLVDPSFKLNLIVGEEKDTKVIHYMVSKEIHHSEKQSI